MNQQQYDIYYAAAIQTDFPPLRTRDGLGERVERLLALAESAIVGYSPFFDVRLLVFPEFAHAAPIYSTAEELHQHLAVSLPNEHIDKYLAFCRKYDCYIQTGTFLEKTARYPGHVFNTTLLLGPEGILSTYRKVNPWIPWEVHTSPADLPDYDAPLFPVVETPIGRIGVAICYDWLFPEVLRALRAQGAEILVRVSAYMDPWGTAEPMNWWSLVNRTRALENQCYVVAANQGAKLANYPPFSWPGGSMIVDYDGRILAQAEAGGGERIVVGPIHLAALRAERARREGHDTMGHLRSHAFDYLTSASRLPPEAERPTIEGLKARIRKSRLSE
ncbi:MAG: nitrilase [Gammaproteobacteria bacterium]|nr:MAG: nitrilase [Gammaproteobacteria bacterium]